MAAVVARAAVAGHLHHRLDGGADVTEMTTGMHGRDSRGQRSIGGVDQPLRFGLDQADAHREGGVAVPAVDDRTAVDRNDVASLQRAFVGDAVHDLVVDGRADHRRIAVIAEEVRRCAAAAQHVPSDSVELQRGHTGNCSGADRLVHLGDHPSGGAHVPQLLGRTTRQVTHHDPQRVASTAAARSRNTASGVPTPSMTASRP